MHANIAHLVELPPICILNFVDNTGGAEDGIEGSLSGLGGDSANMSNFFFSKNTIHMIYSSNNRTV